MEQALRTCLALGILWAASDIGTAAAETPSGTSRPQSFAATNHRAGSLVMNDAEKPRAKPGRVLSPASNARTVEEPPEQALTDERIAQRIGKYRTAEVTLTVRDAAGKPLADTAVTVQQVRHKFLFGCNAYKLGGCDTAAQNAAYKRRFAALLNYATLPFYWGSYEPAEGQTRKQRLTAMARWCAEHQIRAKGHPLCWHEVVPKWLQDKTAPQVQALQFGRITREVTDFAGLIDTWDVVNEAVVMPRRKGNAVSRLCKRLGRVRLIRQAFSLARKANPKAVLILNDFDTSARYEKLIRQCMDAGVEFDIIGIQSHMHKGYWGAQRVWEICERFAKFGKPLHFTEVTILSGKLKTDDDWFGYHPDWNSTAAGERRQAQQVAEFYRVLFSHPAVEAITWWDFSDQGAWQGAPAGLLRKDMTPKPAYETLKKLIKKEWWTGPLRLTTDAKGRVNFRGFLGRYIIKTDTVQAHFAVETPGRLRRTVRLPP